MMKKLLKPTYLSNSLSLGLFLLRLVAGIAFMIHGYGKIQHPFTWMGEGSGFPALLQALAALSEFGGGLAWVLGFLTRIAALGIGSTMSVAVYIHAIVHGDPFISFTGGGAYELPALFLVVSILFLLAGPGRFSLDRYVFGERG